MYAMEPPTKTTNHWITYIDFETNDYAQLLTWLDSELRKARHSDNDIVPRSCINAWDKNVTYPAPVQRIVRYLKYANIIP